MQEKMLQRRTAYVKRAEKELETFMAQPSKMQTVFPPPLSDDQLRVMLYVTLCERWIHRIPISITSHSCLPLLLLHVVCSK